jgi:capsular polysaccharide biosynthesis protein
MVNQHKTQTINEDEINLYDYYKVIVKRKRLIIGLFVIAILASAVISLLMPKIYRGEVVLKLPEKQSQSSITITAKELLSVIGKIDAERILPTTHHLIADVKLTALKDSTDKLQLIIEAKDKDTLPQAAAEFVTYLNDTPIIKRFVEEERQRLLMQLEEINEVIEKSYKRLIKSGRLIPVGFNPIELEKRASDLKIERLIIEQAIQRLKGVEMLEKPYILKNPVKPRIKMNIALAGITSLFAGIFLAFFMEYVERIKLQTPDEQKSKR